MTRNAAQIALWNDTKNTAWVSEPAYLDRMMAEVSAAVVAAAAAQPGEAVLDIGCGSGATTIALAAQVGPRGRVTGVDVSEPLLEIARARASGVANVAFVETDASVHAFASPGADLLFSKFGVMFFDEPEAAFRNLRNGLKSTGRLAFACWRTLAENPFAAVPFEVASRYVAVPSTDATVPGPFSLADEGRIRGILAHAGFQGVLVAALDVEMPMGANAADVAGRAATAGPTARLLATLDPATVAQVRSDLEMAWSRYETPHGVIVPGRCWIVTAHT